MENYYFLENAKQLYDSLKYFSMNNNVLTLRYSGEFQIILEHINLASINPNLYLLSPIEIFQVIYMLELLYKQTLNENETKFIEDYTNKYLKLSTDALNTETSNTSRLWCLSIPIYTSYNPEFINLPGSILIQNLLNKQAQDINSGKNLQPKLVLVKDDLPNLEDDEAMKNFAQAGFTTIVLIATTITLTVLYIIYFMSQT